MFKKAFAILILSFCWQGLTLTPARALNLEKAKVYFLSGDYDACINEGEKILAGSSHTGDIDQLYYLMGLSYLKQGNYLRAGDIFEIILREFRDSCFEQEARLGLADTYFLKGEWDKAQTHYKALLSGNADNKLEAIIYYRLSQCALKRGDSQEAQGYSGKLAGSFPLNLEMRANQGLACPLVYYSVQVGSFASQQNARNLVQKLTQKGYPAYIEESSLQGRVVYRVRVGKFRLRQEALKLAEKLSRQGYPIKISP